MNTQLVKLADFGLNEEMAESLLNGLSEIKMERDSLRQHFDVIVKMDIEDVVTQTAAAKLLSKVKKNRTMGLEKWHKEKKKYFLNGGRFIDSVKNNEIEENREMEKVLTEIKNHHEIKKEKERNRLRKERSKSIELYQDYVPFGMDLGSIPEEEWIKIFKGAKLQYEAQIEEDRKIEEARIENERVEKLHLDRKDKLLTVWEFEKILDKNNLGTVSEEEFNQALNEAKALKESYEKNQARIKSENDKLRKEAEQKEKALEIERKKAKEEADAKIKIEREKQEKLKAELKAKIDAENKAEKERLDKEKREREEKEKLEKAPIKDRINVWIDSFEISNPSINNEVTKDIKDKFLSFKSWAKKEVEKI